MTDALYGISAVNASTAWAVGENGRILKTNTGGLFWSSQASPVSYSLYDVSAVDASTAWAVGLNGTILKTVNGGAEWVPQDSGTSSHLFCIDVVDADTAWAAGTEGSILKTIDGGETWVHQLSVGGSITGISAVDTYTAWAVNSNHEIYKTMDSGESWSFQDSGTSQALNDVSASDATTALAVGSSTTILMTTDGGDARPDIAYTDPSSWQLGMDVTIVGCDFGDAQGDSYVSFGGVKATSYSSWSDREIIVTIPDGISKETQITVTTPAGTSNPMDFYYLSVTSITPDQALQHAIVVNITDLAGSGFLPGATVRFELGDRVIEACDVNVVSSDRITCKIGFFGEQVGAYDVVVRNPDGTEARLEEGFTVNSACGEGGGMAVMMLGITLGLLSLAGGFRLRRKR
jgi:hypothetical protein